MRPRIFRRTDSRLFYKASVQPLFSEHQVKAVFLFNFAKHVDWPPDLFPTFTAPIVIGRVGQENMREDLKRAVDGKSINGRTIVVRRVTEDEEKGSCHIMRPLQDLPLRRKQTLIIMLTPPCRY